MKTKVPLYAITLVIVGLLITSLSATATFRLTETESRDIADAVDLQITKRDEKLQTLSMPAKNIDIPMQHVARPLDVNQVTSGPEDEVHPAIGRNIGGEIVTAWEDPAIDEVVWTYSVDDGVTFDPGIYWDLDGMSTYPSIDYWGQDSRFFGTLVPSYDFLDGAPTTLMECTDLLDYETWTLSYWDWSANEWYGMIDADIACDDSQADWQFGFISLVTSTNYDVYTVVDGPFIFYTTDDAGLATISWYDVSGCAHTMCDIDHVTAKTYAVYDYYNTEDVNDTKWTLLVRQDNFANWDAGGSLYEVEVDGNLTKPAVAAYDNNLLIAAEHDGDVRGFYSDRGMMGALEEVVIAEDASNPEISHAKDTIFVCSYFKDDNLWYRVTEDGGETWGDPIQLNDNDGSAVAEYKGADLAEKGAKAMWGDNRGDSIDIYIGDGYEIIEPFLEITTISGGFGVKADISNVGNGDDTDVEWSITFEEGQGLIILPGGRTKTGTEATIAAGDTVNVKTGLILGFGMVTINVEAIGTENTATGSASGFVLGPLAIGVG